MPVVQLPDGTLVQLPEPEEGVGAKVKKGGMDLVSGFGQSAGGLVSLLGGGVLRTGKEFPQNQKPRVLEKLGDDATKYWSDLGVKEGLEPGYTKSGVQGVGKMLATPIGGPGTTVGVGLTSGLGGELGYNLSGKQPIGRIGGEVLGGGLAGFALGPKQSVGQADVRRALKNKTDFGEVAKNLEKFQQSGVKTATLAEAFPDNHAVRTLASKARDADTGANALKDQTLGRTDDLLDLSNRTVDLIGPRANIGDTAQRAATAAETKLKGLERLRSQDYGNSVASAKPILPQQMKSLEDYLLAEAANPQNIPAKQAAFREFAQNMRGSDGQLITNVRNLVDTWKIAKESPMRRTDSTASKALQTQYDDVYGIANDYLKQVSPGYAKAEKVFQGASEGVIDPARSGPLGKLAGRNLDPNAVVPESRLTQLGNIQDPAELRGVLGNLRANASPAPGNVIQDIASALAQQKTAKGSTNIGETLVGNPGSAMEKNFMTQLSEAGVPSAPISRNMDVGRQLQGNQGPAGLEGIPRMNPWQALIRPFRTADMAMTGRTERSVQREIAELLAAPTQANRKKLEEIMRFDPTARALLTGAGGMLPTLPGIPKEGQ